MWYVIILVLSACSNCWAMNDRIVVDEGKLVMQDGRTLPELWKKAMEYHQTCLGVELQAISNTSSNNENRPLIIENNSNLHERCISYLKDKQNNATLTICKDGSFIAHGLDNSIVLIPSDPQSNQSAIVLNIGVNSDVTTDFVACCFSQSKHLEENHFMVYAVDNCKKLHEWDVSHDTRREKTELKYANWEKTIPGVVTAMQMTPYEYGPQFFIVMMRASTMLG